MLKAEGVYSVEEIRKQVENGDLKGDAVLTLKWLLSEYDSLNNLANDLLMAQDQYRNSFVA